MNTYDLLRRVMITLVVAGTAITFQVGCTDNPADPSGEPGAAFGVAATIISSAEISSAEASDVRETVRRNSADTITVGADEAIALALELFAEAEVLGLHLDYDRDNLRYECVVRSEGKVYVVVISPSTGQVEEKREVEDYYYTGTIGLDVEIVAVTRACDRARSIIDGDVVEANLEEVEGRPTYIIVVLRGNRYLTIYIDAETGKERTLKDERPCDDDNDDDGSAVEEGDTIQSGECDRHRNRRGRGHYRHGNGHGYGHHFHCHCDCVCPDDDENGDDDDDEDDRGDQAGGGDTLQVVTRDSVRLIVQSMIPDGIVGDIKLAVFDDSTAVYETVVVDGDNHFEVTLDARTGALIEVKQTNGDFEGSEFEPTIAADGAMLVSLSVARAVAVGSVAGTISSWKLSEVQAQSRWVYVFTMEERGTGTEKRVRIDAETGLLIDIIG